ncbi:hydroxyacid dehydrogenase [Bosea sp. NBC_00550]|uniref:hydroxyacid dehydrogenase n=1 Tax=Bosea sp. NBC_00550 TaxID=2969621 RepID=UPI0022327C54|nr:hydroxyacid dehydrogenase [Bosea sp. NBC_00550]UZF94925.1 hydroxyacid dehydrogenase [Bosea sp. NBC_00550]
MTSKPANLVYFEQWSDDGAALPILRDAPGIALRRLSYATREDENWAALACAHGYQIAARVELRQPWFGTAELVRRCPNLLVISSTGAGYDVIDVDACTKAGVIVCNQTGSNARAVAEHAVGLMLALSKRIVMTDKAVRDAPDTDRFHFTGNNLHGKTVGILGLGNIGRITAQICRAGFDMNVIAHDPLLAASEIVARGARPVSRDDVFSQADFVSVHCPRADDTFGSIGQREFALMKRSAFFINTARGGIHREDELAAALRTGELAGAGLDVFLHEPPAPDHPLMAFANVIANPHIAGMTAESLASMSEYAARQWLDVFAGRKPTRLVNPAAWPLFSRRYEATFGTAPATAAAPPDLASVLPHD